MTISSLKNGKFTLLLIFGVMLILSLHPFSTNAQDESDDTVNDDTNHDMLAYRSQDGHWMLYNPETRTETLISENVHSFLLSQQGYFAFTKVSETDNNLYFSDLSTPSIAPIPIAQGYPLLWSPDGQYLAFVSYQEEYLELNTYTSITNQSLYVWDGETVTNVMPDNPLDEAVRFYADWGLDGQLVFTIVHGWSNLDIPAEIYLWDGDRTVNLSQNPEGGDSVARWSSNGQLMFGSQRKEGDGIYIWDGISFKDGLPDMDSFTRLAPILDPHHAVWMDNGLIGFTVSFSSTKTIVIWDVEHETIVEQYPITSENAWSWIEEDGQVIISTHLASGSPSYYLDVENLEGEILFSTIVGEFSWSSDGYLAYCRMDDGWVLSIWDGEETWDVARVSYRPVQWQNEGHKTFSCNSG